MRSTSVRTNSDLALRRTKSNQRPSARMRTLATDDYSGITTGSIRQLSLDQQHCVDTINEKSCVSDAKDSLVYAKLISFTSQKPSTEFLISNLLRNGWILPKDKGIHKNDIARVYNCKVHPDVRANSLAQCLSYTFRCLSCTQFEWVAQILSELMTQLSVAQKAMLLSMGVDRQTRKKRDCFVGREAADWMLQHRMADNMHRAAQLAQDMINVGYIVPVASHEFTADDAWYTFDEDSINYDIFVSIRTPSLPPPKRASASQANQLLAMRSPSAPMPRSSYLPPINLKDTRSLQVHTGRTLKLKPRREKGLAPPKTQSPSSANRVVRQCDLIRRLRKHNEVMQCLVRMALSGADDAVIVDNIQDAFYLPSRCNGQRFTCHIVDYVTLEHKADVVEFILGEFWDELFGQNIYCELIGVLTLPQMCKLMRIGLETHTRKYRLKKYKRCFAGSSAVAWLEATGFADDTKSAVELATQCAQKKLIRGIQNSEFKNSDSAFYTLDAHEIESQDCEWSARPVSKVCQHQQFVQNLISMALTPMAEIELLLDLSKAFYLPRAHSKSKDHAFVSKLDADVAFDNVVEALHHVLIELWHEGFAQVVYRKLLSKLSLSQRAKLFSLGVPRRTRKKHFKKFRGVFLGSEACEWLVAAGFVEDFTSALQLANEFMTRGFVTAEGHSAARLESDGLFYRCCDIEINKRVILESYSKHAQVSASFVQTRTATPTVQLSDDSRIGGMFPDIDIDYDVQSRGKLKSFDTDDMASRSSQTMHIVSERDNVDEDEFVGRDEASKELSFPDISTFGVKRTAPMRIASATSSRKSGTFYRQHHNLRDGAEQLHALGGVGQLSPGFGGRGRTSHRMATSNGHLSVYGIKASTTEHTPEPQPRVDEDEYYSSTTPSSSPRAESCNEMSQQVMKAEAEEKADRVSRTHHKNMATRVTISGVTALTGVEQVEMDDEEEGLEEEESSLQFEMDDAVSLSELSSGVPFLTIDVNASSMAMPGPRCGHGQFLGVQRESVPRDLSETVSVSGGSANTQCEPMANVDEGLMGAMVSQRRIGRFSILSKSPPKNKNPFRTAAVACAPPQIGM